MTISEVQRSDSGNYLCQAISVAGSVLAKARLEVEEGESHCSRQWGHPPSTTTTPSTVPFPAFPAFPLQHR